MEEITKIDSNYVAQRALEDSSRKELVKIMMNAKRHYRKIPDDVETDVKASIGSKFDRNTKAPLRGITEQEVQILMPKILKINTTNEKFDQIVNDYFADLNIDVPFPEGTILNITTRKDEIVEIKGKKYKYDMPESPIDYIKYKQCLIDRTVAVSEQDKRNLDNFKFYLEDPREQKKKKLDRIKDLKAIEVPYSELTAIDKDGKLIKEIKAKQVLVLLNRNPYYLTDEDILLEFDSIKNDAVESYDQGVSLDDIPFYQVVNDPDLAAKANITEMVNFGILELIGESYVDAAKPDFVLGTSLSQTVTFLKDPKNQEYKMKYKNSLQEKRK